MLVIPFGEPKTFEALFINTIDVYVSVDEVDIDFWILYTKGLDDL
jgi:hypothetical protein